MKINLKATNIELTEAISTYVNGKLEHLKKFKRYLSDRDERLFCDMEVGKENRHHKQGEVYRAEAKVSFAGHHFYKVVINADLYSAVDQLKDELIEEMSNYSKKRQTLVRRGGRAIKNMLRGLNPWRQS